MQNKLKELYRPADNASSHMAINKRMEGLGLATPLSKATQEAYKKSINETKVAMDKFISDQAKGLEYSAKLIKRQEDGLKTLRSQQQSMTKDSKEYLEVQKQIQATESNIARQRENFAGRAEALNKGLSAREEMPGGGSRASNLMARGAQIGGYLGTAAAGIGGIGLMASQYTGYGQRLEAAKGSAIQGTVGQDLSRVYGGKSAFEQMWSPERRAAEGLATQKEGRNRWTDRLTGIGSALGVGAGIAGMVGSVGLAPFTGGASLSGFLPSAAMAGAGGYGLSNDRNRQGIFGGREYDQLLGAERAKDFRTNYENLKNQDPTKRLALEGYEQNYRGYLGTQRMLGLDDFQLRGGGGFQARGHQAGFMNDQMAGMAQGIVGAGGSSRMGGEAQFGLQMQRAGLTNSSGILGALSGGIGSTQANKQATISIMAEAFQTGLDNTTFAEENRRFTQSVANAIGNAGATSAEDQDRISRMMGQFLGERTNKGVEAATSAYESFQQRGSQTTGRRGAIRMAEAMNDPNLAQLDVQEINELLSARPDQLKVSDPMVKAYAQKAGISPDDLLDRLQKGRDKARFSVPGREAKVKSYAKDVNDYLEKSGMTYAEFAEKANAGGQELTNEGSEQAIKSFGMLQGLINMENPEGFNDKSVTAQVGEEVTARNPNATPQMKAAAQQMLEDKDRLGDQVEAAGAAGEDQARKALNELTPDIRKMAEAANIFTEAITKSATELHRQSGDRLNQSPQGGGMNTDMMSRFAVPPTSSASQPHGGVPKK